MGTVSTLLRWFYSSVSFIIPINYHTFGYRRNTSFKTSVTTPALLWCMGYRPLLPLHCMHSYSNDVLNFTPFIYQLSFKPYFHSILLFIIEHKPYVNCKSICFKIVDLKTFFNVLIISLSSSRFLSLFVFYFSWDVMKVNITPFLSKSL